MKQPNNDVRHAFFGLFRRSATAASVGSTPAAAGRPALIPPAAPDLFALTLQYGCDAYWLCAQSEQGAPSTLQREPETVPHVAP